LEYFLVILAAFVLRHRDSEQLQFKL